MSDKKFTFIDLFSGIGGFRKALENNGGECLYFSEINKDAIETYCTNSNEPIDKNLGDITKIKELPKHNLLTAGVPCQSWSIAGRNLGFDDDRGQLWNDTIYLLNQSRPDAFIFENVKGLVDPRNKKALEYILGRIKEAGYYANYYVLNSFDYGVPQNRIRIYIIGFKNKEFADKFKLPEPILEKIKLADIIEDFDVKELNKTKHKREDSYYSTKKKMSLSASNGFNDYFLFNDLRNGNSTIHSWDILDTSERQKEICYYLLKNRRKKAYGKLDGNPLSLKHFQDLDSTISQKDLDELVNLEILKSINYSYTINGNFEYSDLTEDENIILRNSDSNSIFVDNLKSIREIKINKISVQKVIQGLCDKNIIIPNEKRYDFKNGKISLGLYGINRIFLPTSNIFPTLVASDTNDYVTSETVDASTDEEYKSLFIENVYKKGKYRRITKEEACMIQGFPKDYILPENRARWMKLIGNSVSIPVIEILSRSIIETGVFD